MIIQKSKIIRQENIKSTLFCNVLSLYDLRVRRVKILGILGKGNITKFCYIRQKKPLIVAVDGSNCFKQPHHITHTRIYSLKIRMTTSFIKRFTRIATQRRPELSIQKFYEILLHLNINLRVKIELQSCCLKIRIWWSKL